MTEHAITIEQRPARCCDSHRDTWVLCSCGWENNTRLDGNVNAAIIEAVLNEQKRAAA